MFLVVSGLVCFLVWFCWGCSLLLGLVWLDVIGIVVGVLVFWFVLFVVGFGDYYLSGLVGYLGLCLVWIGLISFLYVFSCGVVCRFWFCVWVCVCYFLRFFWDLFWYWNDWIVWWVFGRIWIFVVWLLSLGWVLYGCLGVCVVWLGWWFVVFLGGWLYLLYCLFRIGWFVLWYWY